MVGDRSVFSEELVQAIEQAEKITRDATAMHLNVCINYGGRWDIAQAAHHVAAEGLELTVENIDRYMGMPWAGPVDLMIRTGGEQRISNFILWQAAYAELWFTENSGQNFPKMILMKRSSGLQDESVGLVKQVNKSETGLNRRSAYVKSALCRVKTFAAVSVLCHS